MAYTTFALLINQYAKVIELTHIYSHKPIPEQFSQFFNEILKMF